MSTAKPSTYILSTLGVLSASALAYALYFDYKRRHDTDFRRALKRESKKQARAAREQAEEQGRKGRTEIREMVDAAIEEGFPPTAEEKEIYFMERLSEGEGLCQKSEFLSPAECFIVWKLGMAWMGFSKLFADGRVGHAMGMALC